MLDKKDENPASRLNKFFTIISTMAIIISRNMHSLEMPNLESQLMHSYLAVTLYSGQER